MADQTAPDFLEELESHVQAAGRLPSIRVRVKLPRYTVKADSDCSILTFFEYDAGSRVLAAVVLCSLILIMNVFFQWNILAVLGLVGLVCLAIFSPARAWRFDTRSPEFQQLVTVFGAPVSIKRLSRDIFQHTKFDIKVVLWSAAGQDTAGARNPGRVERRFDGLAALAQALGQELPGSTAVEARVPFRLYSKGDQAGVIVRLPEMALFCPETSSLLACGAPLDGIITAMFPPRVLAFLHAWSKFYPVTSTFFTGKTSKVKNTAGLRVTHGTRSRASARSIAWEILELIVEFLGCF